MKLTELMRVRAQNARARSMGTTATLTLAEWEQTLADFNNMCAYCLIRPFTALEHFIAFGQVGDGTHVHNCLPACQSCNNLKKNRPLEEIIKRFDRERIDQLQTYLAGRSHIEDTVTFVKRTTDPKAVPQPKREKPSPVPIPPDAPYVTLEQAASGLGMSRGSIYPHIKYHSIQVHKFPRSKHGYITREDFELLLIAKETPWKIPGMMKQRPS